MTAQIVDQEHGIAFLQKLLDKREHWIIVGASPMGFDVMEIIENTFYDDGSMGAILLPLDGVIITIAFCSKLRMSSKDLAQLLYIPEPKLADIILSSDTPLAVFQWMEKTFSTVSLN